MKADLAFASSSVSYSSSNILSSSFGGCGCTEMKITAFEREQSEKSQLCHYIPCFDLGKGAWDSFDVEAVSWKDSSEI